MQKRLLIAICLALLMVASTSVAEETKMNLNVTYGATNVHTQGAVDFAKRVAEYSGGSVEIAVRSGGALGFNEADLLQMVKVGRVSMSDILMGAAANSEHVFGISTLPRIVKDYSEARKLYIACKPLYEKAAQNWNQKIIYAAPWPPSGLATKKIGNRAADVKALKTRTFDNTGAQFIKAMGGEALVLPWEEVYSALRTGKINSVLTSAESAKEGKFWDVVTTFVKIDYAYPLNMLTINMDAWNTLSKEQQGAVIRAAGETEDAQWEIAGKRDAEALAYIKQKGMIVLEENPEFVEAMNKAAGQIVESYLSNADENVKAALKPFVK